MEGITTVLLKNLVNRKIGYGIVQPGDSKALTVPVVKVNNIITGLNNVEILDKTTEEINKKYSRTVLQGGELLVSVVGTIGKTVIVPHSFAGCNIARAVAMIDIVDPLLSLWVKYYIDSPKGQSYIIENLNTTVQATLNIKDLENMPIPIYDKKELEQRVNMLRSFDDKIELNNRINHNLEEQAQALYKSWFVDFEPFKESEFVDSTFGLIPKGWKNGVLSDISTITMGQSPSGASFNENGDGIMFYQGRTEFGFRYPTIKLFTTEPTRYAEANSVLMSVRAPVGDINIASSKCCIGRGLASIKSNDKAFSFLLYSLKHKETELDLYNGEGTVFGSINRKGLEQLPIIVPPQNVIDSFNKIVYPLDKEIEKNCREAMILQDTRDYMLPSLMSGRIITQHQ